MLTHVAPRHIGTHVLSKTCAKLQHYWKRVAMQHYWKQIFIFYSLDVQSNPPILSWETVTVTTIMTAMELNAFETRLLTTARGHTLLVHLLLEDVCSIKSECVDVSMNVTYHYHPSSCKLIICHLQPHLRFEQMTKKRTVGLDLYYYFSLTKSGKQSAKLLALGDFELAWTKHKWASNRLQLENYAFWFSDCNLFFWLIHLCHSSNTRPWHILSLALPKTVWNICWTKLTHPLAPLNHIRLMISTCHIRQLTTKSVCPEQSGNPKYDPSPRNES